MCAYSFIIADLLLIISVFCIIFSKLGFALLKEDLQEMPPVKIFKINRKW